ncbi:MAG: type I methionyl aminopeptidase [Chloroflexi bacterium]|nr:type I methionyl aminopeptidase [Chloroflexota bacterium]
MERSQGLVLKVDSRNNGITIKSPQEVLIMREAGRVTAAARDAVVQAVQPGIKTRELDAIAAREIKRLGAKPSFKGYRGFPATICCSINNEIVHGIPGDRIIQEGDLVSIDVGAVVGGFHGDSAVTVIAGKAPSPQGEQLVAATQKSLELGIQQAVAGNRTGDIAAAVQEYAEGLGYGVVKEYVGHGVGRSLHEDPAVPNVGRRGVGPLLRVGMVIAIEPMLNMGTWATQVLDDDWTVVTADGSLSAHFEHTIAITEHGPWVLTVAEGA